MFLKLFSGCEIIAGAKYSIILDTQRQKYHRIHDTMGYIIEMLEEHSIEEIRESINYEDTDVFDSYINFLIENELAFITNTPNDFKYNDENLLTKNDNLNSIIEGASYEDIIDKINIINSINVEALHINLYSTATIHELILVLNKISRLEIITSFSLLFKYDKSITDYELNDLIQEYPIVRKIYIYDAPGRTKSTSHLAYITQSISTNSCGSIDTCFFSCNELFYREARFVNSCLYNKISIDINGNIKNCPSMSESFGNVKKNSLKEVLDNSDFRKYWDLTKENIQVCKDCEFRYICSDCRAYTERTHYEAGLDTSKPLKCGYDPYSGEWEDWSVNPLKKSAIEYYGL